MENDSIRSASDVSDVVYALEERKMIDLLSVREAAKLIGLKPVTLYEAIREGRIRSIDDRHC